MSEHCYKMRCNHRKDLQRCTPPTKQPLCAGEPRSADASSGGAEGPLSSGACIGLNWGSLPPAHLDNPSQLLGICNKFAIKGKKITVGHLS